LLDECLFHLFLGLNSCGVVYIPNLILLLKSFLWWLESLNIHFSHLG